MIAKPPVYVAAALVAMAAAHACMPIDQIFLFPWNLVGIVPLLLGAGLILHAFLLFIRNGTTSNPDGVPAALVTSGPFRVTRNPMYLGILLMFSGIACLFGTVGPWLAVPALGVVFDVVFIRREEKRMETIFDDAYRRYKAKVRRWI
jgi:protein-S-isoprenylcysteine O-methyltransferase Ste14